MTQAKVPQVGEVLAGKYTLKRVLGEGGMGVVIAAEHARLRQDVAIKFLNPQMLESAEIVERFDREARAAATLRSRHVVRVTDVEQTPDGVPYMVMELLQGVDLETERERRQKLPYDEVVDYVVQACAALVEAHEAGIVHRDLKPANLFLAQQSDDAAIVKVLDFGISKFLQEGDAKLTSAGTIMGTALYMSPEQIRGDAMIDARADVWSLGVILYELIGGKTPWDGPPTRVAAAIVAEKVPPLSALAALPRPLEATIERMLAKDPAERPQRIADVVSALAPFLPRGTVGADVAEQIVRRMRGSRSSPELATFVPSEPSPERSTNMATSSSLPMRRPPKVLGVAIAFGLLAVIGIALIAFTGQRAKPPTVAGPVPEASSAPVVGAREIPPPVETASAVAVVSAAPSVEPPRRPGAAATPPRSALPVVTPPSPAKPAASTPKPAASTPLFL